MIWNLLLLIGVYETRWGKLITNYLTECELKLLIYKYNYSIKFSFSNNSEHDGILYLYCILVN